MNRINLLLLLITYSFIVALHTLVFVFISGEDSNDFLSFLTPGMAEWLVFAFILMRAFRNVKSANYICLRVGLVFLWLFISLMMYTLPLDPFFLLGFTFYPLVAAVIFCLGYFITKIFRVVVQKWKCNVADGCQNESN